MAKKLLMTVTPVMANVDFTNLSAQLEITEDCPADAMGECMAQAMGECMAQAMQNIEPWMKGSGNPITYIVQFIQGTD